MKLPSILRFCSYNYNPVELYKRVRSSSRLSSERVAYWQAQQHRRCLSMANHRGNIARSVKNSHNLKGRALFSIDNQVRALGPEANRTISHISAPMPLAWPSGKLFKCFQEPVDVPICCGLAIPRNKIPNVLQIFKRLGRKEVTWHRAYLEPPRRNLERTSSLGIPLPAFNCASPRSIFCCTSARCC
jgi:hypothetical protein